MSMILFSCFVAVLLSAAGTDGLPNSFKYDNKRHGNLVQEFEMLGNQEPGHVKNVKAFSWSDCGGPTSILHVESLSISPDPLGVPGDLNIAAKFDLTDDLSPTLSVDLELEKKEFGVFIKIPCIDGYGSCTYNNLCESLAQVGSQCPPPVQKLLGGECKCPIKTGSYNLPKSSIPIMAAVVPSGDYKVKANVKKNGKPAACLNLTFSIA